MRSIAIVLACLACVGQSRRSQTLSDHKRLASNAKSGILDSFATFLLATTPGVRMGRPRAQGVTGTRNPQGLARARSAVMQTTEETWQSSLDKALLSIDLDPQERLRLLQQSLGDPALKQDVESAFASIQTKGMNGAPDVIDKLWPKGTIARSDLEGLAALRKQVPELIGDFEKQTQSPGNFPSSPPSLPDPISAFNSFMSFATDSNKQNEVIEEVQDAFRSTPKGLETPKYEVVRTIDNPEPIELRKYEEFTVASTSVERGFNSRSGGTGFNTLASYLFGKNEENREMKMTMPVEISATDSDGSMSFVLPEVESESPPTPLSSSDVTVSKVPARLVAAKPFPGIVTDQEVERQKASLLEALADDGSVEPVDDRVSVLQYNSPFTIPWRRRNEIAIVVREKVASEATMESDESEESEETAMESEKSNDVQSEEGVVSWYDSGIRL